MTRMSALLLSFFFIISSSHASKFLAYSEAVDVFEIMEGVSGWQSSDAHPYFTHWKENLKLGSTEKRLLSDYRDLRQKYSRKAKEVSGPYFFTSDSVALDPFYISFYSSKSIGEALTKLKKHIKPKEVKFLAEFYKHFIDDISTMVKESSVFSAKVKAMNKSLDKKKIKQVLSKAKRFMGINKIGKKKFRAFLVWWPKDTAPMSKVVGNTVILYLNPITHINDLIEETIIQEMVRSYIAFTPINVKSNLSKLIDSKCKLSTLSLNKDSYIERPLAIALGRIYSEKLSMKKEFDLFKVRSHNLWEQLFSEQIFSLYENSIKQRKEITSDFGSRLSEICMRNIEFAKKI